MTARDCVPETFDRRMIMVPNDHFITSRVTDHSTDHAPNRHTAAFSVSCDSDINLVPGLIEKAVAALPFVQTLPGGPEVG